MSHCLIVDDSRVTRRIMRDIMQGQGFMCGEAENGRLALEYCRHIMPDIIMLDWNMPVMNGIEFLKLLREEPNGGDPVVIFCTTENDMDHIQMAMGAGANDYIMKPFDGDIIRGKLEQNDIVPEGQ
ncbi:MAG: PleD family two-component system response regulator [Alphaproteobacteria bacterium]